MAPDACTPMYIDINYLLDNIIVIYIVFISISQFHSSASFELCISDIKTAL